MAKRVADLLHQRVLPTLKRYFQMRIVYFGIPKSENQDALVPLVKLPTSGRWPIAAAELLVAQKDSHSTCDFGTAPTSEAILEVSRECQRETGFYPISFSSPFPCTEDSQLDRKLLFSEIVPGHPYSFTSDSEYLAAYSNSYYGITHKKGGWDCFRHLEIMRAGTVPFMPDASGIPKYSMVHYPKELLAIIGDQREGAVSKPSQQTRSELTNHFNRHLTTQAMARYISEIAVGLSPSRILFIDESLPTKPDYLSLLTLIGLKQNLGINCLTMIPVPYLYTDWRGRNARLYGRGLGYTRVLPQEVRESHRVAFRLKTVLHRIRRDEFDLVVFGSIMRNVRIFQELRTSLDPSRTVLINGEDLEPTEDARRFMVNTKCKIFVRSL